MGLELLSQADYVLNACGRPVPPKGYRFVDLPKMIPFHQTFQLPAFDFVKAPPSGGGSGSEFTITSRSNPNLNVVATNNGPPAVLSVTVLGNLVTINIPNATTTVATIVAFLNADPSFRSVAIAAVVTAGDAAFPTTVTTFSGTPAPTQARVENLSNTLFLVRAVGIVSDPVSVRIKWPNGHYWNQYPSNNPDATSNAGANFPQGVAGNSFALDEEIPIERGGKIAIEMSGSENGPVDVQFWGVLRYLLKATGSDLAAVDGETCIIGYPNQAQSQKAPNCLIGYPVSAASKGQMGSVMIPDPVAVLRERQRFHCWPNGNILAPEFLLGNQCHDDGEPYTLFSNSYTVAAGAQNYSNSVIVPGRSDMRIRRFRAITTWAAGASGTPLVGLRSPTGYSITGGDLIPIDLGYWYPLFPSWLVKHGTDIIIDLALPGNAVGSVTVQLEFDCAKVTP